MNYDSKHKMTSRSFFHKMTSKSFFHCILSHKMTSRSFFHRILSHREVSFLLDLSQCFLPCFVLRESATHGSCLLHSEVQGFVLAGCVELPQVVSLCVRDHRVHSCHRLSYDLDIRRSMGYVNIPAGSAPKAS